MSSSRGRRGAALAWVLVAALAGAAGGCKATGTKAETKEGASPAPAKVVDFFSCRKDSDCVVEKQKDCCPCNAGGAQIAVRKDAADDYVAARAARCGGDLMCPQVYLCKDGAAAACVAGRCTLAAIGGSPR